MSGEQEVGTQPMPTVEEFFEFFTSTMDAESDLMPMLWYHSPTHGLVFCVLADTAPPDQGGMQATVGGLLMKLRQEVGPANWIWFGSEAYAKVFDEKPEGDQRPKPGELQAFYGLDPSIREVVLVNGVCRDGHSLAQRTFTREDGKVTWLEDLTPFDPAPTQDMGGIPQLLQAALG